ncbi:MAG: acetyl-coenzyme A synthetase N-terminal domain-containing protein, partial [Planctomycetota bacterium]
MQPSASIDSVLNETRLFPPPADFAARMGTLHVPDLATYQVMHDRSIRDPEGFWGEVAKGFHWFKPWGKVLEWNLPDAKWFVGGQT